MSATAARASASVTWPSAMIGASASGIALPAADHSARAREGSEAHEHAQAEQRVGRVIPGSARAWAARDLRVVAQGLLVRRRGMRDERGVRHPVVVHEARAVADDRGDVIALAIFAVAPALQARPPDRRLHGLIPGGSIDD